LRQLAQLAGIAPRTLRVYLQRGVLPRPPFKGSATRYERRQLLWLCAIRHLLATERLTLAAIRTRLNALSAPELEAFAIQHAPPGKLADALGMGSPAASVGPAARALVESAEASGCHVGKGGSAASHLPGWRRVELALGVELHVRDDAGVDVQELSRRVRAVCETLANGALTAEARSGMARTASPASLSGRPG
jgi:DNA-binding transcriptional MerR regulator